MSLTLCSISLRVDIVSLYETRKLTYRLHRSMARRRIKNEKTFI